MSQRAISVLVAYATLMTLLAAKFGSQAFLYQRMLSRGPTFFTGRTKSYEQIIGNFFAPDMNWPLHSVLSIVGGFDTPAIFAASVVVLLSCLGLSSSRRLKRPPEAPPQKD